MTGTRIALVAGALAVTSFTALARQATTPPAQTPPAQTTPAPPQGAGGRGPAPLQNPTPHYASVVMTLDVNAPVDKVWARVGKYCDIGEWGFNGCTIVSGKDNELGAVRSIGSEILVGRTHIYLHAASARHRDLRHMLALEAKALQPTLT